MCSKTNKAKLYTEVHVHTSLFRDSHRGILISHSVLIKEHAGIKGDVSSFRGQVRMQLWSMWSESRQMSNAMFHVVVP